MNTANTPKTRRVAAGLSDRTIARTVIGSVTQWTYGKGLYLKANWTPGGFHSWRFDFKNPTTGKRDTMTIGPYPAVTIPDAVEAAADARVVIARGECPKEVRRKAEQAKAEGHALIAAGKAAPGTVRALAEEVQAGAWKPAGERPAGYVPQWSDEHARRWLMRLERHAFPTLGNRHAADVTPADVYPIVQKLKDAGKAAEARKVRFSLDQCFSLAQAKGLRADNPVQPIAKVMRAPMNEDNHPAVRTLGELVELFKAIHTTEPTKRAALLMFLYTAQRSANVREMEWAELDLDAGMWTIPSAKMKRVPHLKLKGDDHMVPLSRQAVEVLREHLANAPKDAAGAPVSRFVFYVEWRDPQGLKPIGEKFAREALYDLGFRDRQSLHGFRALFRSVCSEQLGINTKVLECQIAHGNGEPLGRAYARETWLDQRAEAVQAWADYIDRLTASGTVVELLKRAA